MIRAWIRAHFYDRAMRTAEDRCLAGWRRELVGDLSGHVLEIGSGTGLNLSHYPSTVTRLVLSEPDPFMRRQLETKVADRAGNSVQVVDCVAEKLEFPDASFDTVVSTLVLCSVRDPQQVLAEIRRVLRPGGVLAYFEHVAADNPSTLRWQQLVEPAWKFLAGNCHLTRHTHESIQAAGLDPVRTEHVAMIPAPQLVRRVVKGLARRVSEDAGRAPRRAGF